MVNFDKIPHWSEREKIEYLQRKILIMSIAYYRYDTSMISDERFDSMCHQLVSMQNDYNGETKYGYAFKDFDGSTGFDLEKKLRPGDRIWLLEITNQIMNTFLKNK